MFTESHLNLNTKINIFISPVQYLIRKINHYFFSACRYEQNLKEMFHFHTKKLFSINLKIKKINILYVEGGKSNECTI